MQNISILVSVAEQASPMNFYLLLGRREDGGGGLLGVVTKRNLAFASPHMLEWHFSHGVVQVMIQCEQC